MLCELVFPRCLVSCGLCVVPHSLDYWQGSSASSQRCDVVSSTSFVQQCGGVARRSCRIFVLSSLVPWTYSSTPAILSFFSNLRRRRRRRRVLNRVVLRYKIHHLLAPQDIFHLYIQHYK